MYCKKIIVNVLMVIQVVNKGLYKKFQENEPTPIW